MIIDNILVPRRSSDFQECIFADYLAMEDSSTRIVPGFEVRSLTVTEQSEIVKREATIMPPPHRAWIHLLSDAIPTQVRHNPGVEAALAALRARFPSFQSALAALQTMYS